MTSDKNHTNKEEKPPIFKKWSTLYLLVIAFHILMISLFSWLDGNISMNYIDWTVLAATLIFIVSYGIWKTRGSRNIEGYLLGDKSMKWGTIGLSIMATQASAITFLSTPGQAYLDGMGFVQIYFGLPFAIVIVCVAVLPIYRKLKVYTAYEYLENRFDLKSRMLTAFLFLIARGLAAGVTIYAPAIILSSIIEIPLNITILIIGVLVIILYRVRGY